LPLREADTMFDRVGPEAMYIRAQAFIREHLRDPDLCIDQISAALGCTKRYLHMLFSDKGMNRQRLYLAGEAAALPAGAGDPERQDDHGCRIFVGFSSSSHFSRVFRKHFGFVPSAIHKAHCADQARDAS